MNKMITVLLTLALLAATCVCAAAETETETFTFYSVIDEEKHRVSVETWEYPIVDGERGSGKVIEDEEYEEPHTLEDGECAICGFSEKTRTDPVIAPKPTGVDGSVTEPKSSDAATDEAHGETAAEAAPATFATASGAVVAKGIPAVEALRQVFAALPADTQVAISGVSEEAAQGLRAVIDGSGAAAELLEALADFPVETVDGIECYIVTLEYAGVTERYAISAQDGTLVKVF